MMAGDRAGTEAGRRGTDTAEIPSDAADMGAAPDVADAGEAAPHADAQVRAASDALSGIEAITPEVWAQLAPGERLEALQQIERQMAVIEGRPDVPIVAAPMADELFGQWDGTGIAVNEAHIAGGKPVEEVVNTVVHEGRHAYQDYAVQHPETASPEQVEAWSENRKNYLDVERYGQELYQAQPLEADAFSFADAVAPPPTAESADPP